MRGQKGITLVALIITIIVLLILAVVAIGAISQSDIMGKAQTAVDTHKQAEKNELDTLQSYSNYITNATPKAK